MIKKIKNTLFLLTFLIIVSCKHHKEEPIAFDWIDFSYVDIPQEFYSVKIYENGKVYFGNYNFGKACYFKFFERNVVENISQKVKSITSSKTDSLFVSGCNHCVTYCLIIYTKNKKFKTTFQGQLFANKYRMPLDSFVCYLNSLSANLNRRVDTTIVFESWSKFLLPPPPPPEILEQKVRFTAPKKIEKDIKVEVKDSLNINEKINPDSNKN